jgi:uncharacterized protein (DUF433 family)
MPAPVYCAAHESPVVGGPGLVEKPAPQVKCPGEIVHLREGGAMKSESIEIIDRGRGPQLSTSRVTVQDLVPYFQEGCTSDEIIRWIPTLTVEEIAVVERFYREHQGQLDEEDRAIRERSGQNKNPPWVEKVLEKARAERLAITERLRQQANGEAK